jgi:hypothetical protein
MTLHTYVLPWWDTWIFCAVAIIVSFTLIIVVMSILYSAHPFIQLGAMLSVTSLFLWAGIHLLTVSAYQSSHAHYRVTATGMIPQVTQDLLQQANERFRAFAAHCLHAAERVQP